MQIWEDLEVVVEGKSFKVRALFDTGSNFTVMGYSIFKEIFGDIPTKPLPEPWKAALVNGQEITISSFVDSQIAIDKYVITERIYLSKDIVKRIMLEDREVVLPDLIIGSPTMETWGIELDLKKGKVVMRGGSFIL